MAAAMVGPVVAIVPIAEASMRDDIQTRSMIVDVEDTYRIMTCVMGGMHNKNKYDVTYKSLRFNTSYAKVGQITLEDRYAGCDGDPSHYAEYLKMQYQYRTW